MPPPRTFDYELLRRLIKEHPEWPYADYAELLTQDARKTDPHAPKVKPGAISRVISQYRDTWAEEGTRVPPRGVVHTDLLPPTGSVPPGQRMSTPLRYLREISAHRRGEPPVTDHQRTQRNQALRWEARLRENREIVDLTPNGIVEVRPARADELDNQGKLLELAAWAIPGRELAHRRQSLRGRG